MKSDLVLVAGGGTMGSGIAQVCAQSGRRVLMADVSAQALERALAGIAGSLAKLAQRGGITEDPKAVLARITPITDYAKAAQADLVIEAVFEDLEIKRQLFARLEPLLGPEAVLATNTSALPISAVAGQLEHPERMLGLHFFNPVPMLQAVEVIKGIATSQEVFQFGAQFVRSLGKEPILVQADIAGFILNRANMLTNLEAMRLVENQMATPEDIDKGFRLAFGRKMGPLETSDLVGLDVQLMAYTNVYNEERDPKFYPPSILRRKVLAGHLGRKTGRGWYEYNPDGSRRS